MKKLLVAALAVGGAAVWHKVRRDRAEQDLWAEATDPVGTPAPAPAAPSAPGTSTPPA